MTNTPKLTTTTLVLIACTAGAASADVVDDVAINISLFDELLNCSASSSFVENGFDSASSCRQWYLDVNARIQAEGDLLAEGFDCTADELMMGGHLLWFGDAQAFDTVKEKFGVCRIQVASN